MFLPNVTNTFQDGGDMEMSGTESNPEHKSETPELLKLVLNAHGGHDHWAKFNKVTARVVSGGFLWAMKGVPLDDTPRRMTSEFRRQWSCTEPFGDPSQ